MMKAYTGAYPYAFMSYSHKDEDKIKSVVQKLQSIGCNIWYDEGIVPADEWAETIAKKLANASLFFLVLSKNSIASQNVKREIYYAVSNDLPILTYYLEDVDLSQGLAMQLGISQSIHATNNTETDCNAIKNIFPQDAVARSEPEIIHSTPKYLYAFANEYNKNEYSIIQINRETRERCVLFRHVDSSAFLSIYSCESIHFSLRDEFNPNQESTLYFSIYSDLDPDCGTPAPSLYVQVDFSITGLESEHAKLKVLGGRQKRKEDLFEDAISFDDSGLWVKNEIGERLCD